MINFEFVLLFFLSLAKFNSFVAYFFFLLTRLSIGERRIICYAFCSSPLRMVSFVCGLPYLATRSNCLSICYFFYPKFVRFLFSLLQGKREAGVPFSHIQRRAWPKLINFAFLGSDWSARKQGRTRVLGSLSTKTPFPVGK